MLNVIVTSTKEVESLTSPTRTSTEARSSGFSGSARRGVRNFYNDHEPFAVAGWSN